jgi:uncharacterized membrane protein YGL010W/acyl-coenzyme A thioesterase PaaI-like protein
MTSLLKEYARSHRHPVNRIIHKICVPLILWSIVGFASLVTLADALWANGAVILSALALLFYLRLDALAFLQMLFTLSICAAACLWLNARVESSWGVYAVAFGLGWIGQAIGHILEGERPSFFTDLQFLLIGPLWVMRGGPQPSHLPPPPGFTLIDNLPFEIGAGRTLFTQNDTHLNLYGHATEKKLWGQVRFNRELTGPPKHAHGGAQAYVLDEAMGTVCWQSLKPVVAKSIQVEFKKMVPLHADLVVTAEIVGEENGDVHVVSELLDADGHVLAKGSGLFHILAYAQFEHLLRQSKADLSLWFPELRK